jgi:hypothetical protein
LPLDALHYQHLVIKLIVTDSSLVVPLFVGEIENFLFRYLRFNGVVRIDVDLAEILLFFLLFK